MMPESVPRWWEGMKELETDIECEVFDLQQIQKNAQKST